MMRLALWFLVLAGTAFAQQQLLVNGVPVPGISTALVRGHSYAPLEAFAGALGAAHSYDAGANQALLELGGHLLAVRVHDQPEAASADRSALSVNGQPQPGEGALTQGGEVFVPVKPIALALGGAVTYLESRQTVMVVLPRARLTDANVSQGGRRIVLEVAGVTAYQSLFNRALNTLQLRLDRTDLSAPQSFSGDGFSRAVLAPSAGYAELRLTLSPGFHAEVFTAPTPQGFSLVVDIVSDQVAPAALARRIVIDPGHGGRDPGLMTQRGSEASLTLHFAQALAQELSQRGHDAQLTRAEDADVTLQQRGDQGIGASLYLALHADSLSAGRYNLYYLSDAQDAQGMNLALRENAQGAPQGTDTLRRRLLLSLIPDYQAGERYAREVSALLGQQAGLQAASLRGAPLGVLEGAAGRGLLLELSPEDLADPALPGLVAAALARALESAD